MPSPIKLIIKNVSLSISTPENAAKEIAKKRLLKCFSKSDILTVALYKKSIDARKKNDIRFVYSFVAEISVDKSKISDGILKNLDASILDEGFQKPEKLGDKPLLARPVIVGFGPCGMFAGLILAEYGYKPIIIERGASPAERFCHVNTFLTERKLNLNSNIQFGAGGAGMFSDGKLITRINDKKCAFVLEEFQKYGAPKDILYKAKPHIGTDYLIKVIENIEKKIVSLGGEVHYNTKFIDYRASSNEITEIITDKGNIAAGALILAIGHSARDTYHTLISKNLDIIPKDFSVGARIEHLQSDIDFALYGNNAKNPVLPKGEYALSSKIGDRYVYTFCMCPGGQVMAATSEENAVVTNGMSLYARDGKNANSAVCVSVSKNDYGNSPEKAIVFQRMIENNAYIAGGSNYFAPCQTVGSFLGNEKSNKIGRILPTYMNGNVKMTDISKIFPKFITSALKAGLLSLDKKIKGFAVNDALLTGAETRTSAPLRIVRNEAFVCEKYENLYPAGEGAGYAGGIMSAACDGLSVAIKIIEKYRP